MSSTSRSWVIVSKGGSNVLWVQVMCYLFVTVKLLFLH